MSIARPAPFALLLASTVVSGIGTGMSLIGIPWALVAGGGDTSRVSAYLMGSYVALTLTLPRFSNVVDRSSRKRVAERLMATGFVAQLVAAGAVALGAGVAILVASGFASILLRSFDQVNRTALAGDLFDPDDYHSLNRWLEVSRQFITLTAGGAAALALGRWPIVYILLVDAATYLVSMVLIRALPSPRPACEGAPTQPPPPRAAPTRSELRGALDILARDRRLLMYSLATLVPFIVVLTQNALYPAHFRSYLGASGESYALDSVIYGSGAVLATALVKVRNHGISRGALVRGAFAGFFVALLATALVPRVLVTYAGSFVFAICHAAIRIERSTLLLRVFERREIGRVTGLFEALATAANVVLIGLVGLLVDRVSVRAGWLLLALVLVPAGLVIWSVGPEVTDQDDRSRP